jgi:hypothetical protein
VYDKGVRIETRGPRPPDADHASESTAWASNLAHNVLF